MENQKERLFLDLDDGLLKPDTGEGNLIPLPQWSSAQGYQLMDSFIAVLPNALLASRLRDALQSGQGVFRRFKTILSEHPLCEQLWRQFKTKFLRSRALEWLSRWSEALELDGIAPEPDDWEEVPLLEFTLQNACDADMPTLRQWDTEAQIERYSALSTSERDAAVERERGGMSMLPQEILTALSPDGDLTGFAWMPIRDREAWLLQVYVPPAWRGLGLGRLLCERSIADARRQDVKRIGVFITETGRNLEGWLKRSGFQREVVAWTSHQ